MRNNLYLSKIYFYLFLCLICTIKSEEITYDGEKSVSKKFENVEINKLDININALKLPPYTKILVEGNEDINYVISIYSDKERENRIQIAQSSYKKSVLFLTEEQIKSKIIYANIECSSTPCSYNIVIGPQQKILLEEGEQLYYYVTKENSKMEFEINLKSEKANIWSRGAYDISNTLSNSLIGDNKKNYFIFQDKKDKNVTFEVIGTIGDIINVGSIGYNAEKSNKQVISDEESMTVFLKKSLFEEACFDLRTREDISEKFYVFLEGIIQANILHFTTEKDGQTIDDESELFTNGKISHKYLSNVIDEYKICFSFPDEKAYPQYKNIEEIIFNFHLTKGKYQNKGLYFNEPLIFGKLYPGNLLLNEFTAYVGLMPLKNYLEINYNLFNKDGFSNLYIYNCDNYPLCFNKNGTKAIRPRNIAKFTTYSIYKNELTAEYNPISKNQILLIVYCIKTKSFDFSCDFDTLVFTNEDSIYMNENQYFNQYLLKGESDKFKIDFSRESQITHVNIEVIVYTGEVSIVTNPLDQNKYNQEFSSNKYFINIELNKNSEKIDDIGFSIKAIENTYYTIIATFVRAGQEIKNEISPGMANVITIDHKVNNKAIIKVRNPIDFEKFIVNFYSLNCNLDIYKKENEDFIKINKYDYYFIDINNFIGDHPDYFEYQIEVKKEDFMLYTENLCLLNLNSADQTKQFSHSDENIIISDNIPQQIKLSDKRNHISYAYIHVDNRDDILIKFNLLHVSNYNVKIFFEYTERKQYNISSNEIIYLNHNEWTEDCPDDKELCYIIIDITLDKTKDVEEPILELSAQKSNAETSVYIPKNIMKKDYGIGNIPQKYFTNIGKDEIGYIYVNFNRNINGYFNAKLVDKNSLITDFDKSDKNILHFDNFEKKIFLNTTSQCQGGCNLLVSVQTNSENSYNYYPFSIIINSEPITQKTSPIKISFDEYIIGTAIYNNMNISNVYLLYIKQDTNNIVLELNSEEEGLYINIAIYTGTNLSSKTYIHIEPETKDSINFISKEQILNMMDDKEKNDTSDITLIIGFYHNITNSPLSFIAHLENDTNNIIYKINSEKKRLCQTINSKENEYRCLFLIENHFIEQSNSLFIYPNLKEKTANYQIYAEYIDYYTFNFKSLPTPTKGSIFSTENSKSNFLYIKDGLEKGKNLLVSVVSSKETMIELMTSFYSNLNTIIPNPKISELFLLKKNKFLKLDFPKEKIIMANLVSVTGEAEIYWEDTQNNIYYLNKEDDKLSLSSLKENNGKLVIYNTNENTQDDIGFAFYLTYNSKHKQNLNEIIIGQSNNLVYSENDFPLTFYSKIKGIDKNLDIYFTFYEMDTENNENIYNGPSIEGKVILTNENNIYKIKSNQLNSIDLSKGIKFNYDPSLKSGYVKLTIEQLKQFNINDKPYLYLELKKVNNEKNYKRINMQISINEENNLTPLLENIYHFGTLSEQEKEKIYILKSFLQNNYLYFEFSSNNDAVTFSLEPENGDKLEQLSDKKENGKNIYSYKIEPDKYGFIKLVIKKNDSDKNKANFVFKYIYNVEDKKYSDYSIDKNEPNIIFNLDKSNGKKIYKIKINSVKNSEKYNVNYYIKLINTNNNLSNSTIAILDEENIIVKEFKNPKSNNGQVEFEVNPSEGNYKYIHVLAQIIDKNITEFLSYKLYELPKDESKKVINDDDEDDDDDGLKTSEIVLIIISVLLVVIVAALVVLLLFYKKKTKNLAQEVNKISFSDEDGLLERNNKE